MHSNCLEIATFSVRLSRQTRTDHQPYSTQVLCSVGLGASHATSAVTHSLVLLLHSYLSCEFALLCVAQTLRARNCFALCETVLSSRTFGDEMLQRIVLLFGDAHDQNYNTICRCYFNLDDPHLRR